MTITEHLVVDTRKPRLPDMLIRAAPWSGPVLPHHKREAEAEGSSGPAGSTWQVMVQRWGEEVTPSARLVHTSASPPQLTGLAHTSIGAHQHPPPASTAGAHQHPPPQLTGLAHTSTCPLPSSHSWRTPAPPPDPARTAGPHQHTH